MNWQVIAILVVSFLTLFFLLFNGVGWFLQKIEEYENRPTKE